MSEEEDIVIVAADWRKPLLWLLVLWMLLAACSFVAGVLYGR